MSIGDLSNTTKAIVYLGSVVVAAFAGGLVVSSKISNFQTLPEKFENLASQVESLSEEVEILRAEKLSIESANAFVRSEEQEGFVKRGGKIRLSTEVGNTHFFLATDQPLSNSTNNNGYNSVVVGGA